MDFVSSDFIGIVYALLPGFLAAWIFHGLTGYRRGDVFRQVVQALIFTVVVSGLVGLVAVCIPSLSTRLRTGSDYRVVISSLVAVAVGFTFALFANNDWLHKMLRKIGITSRNSAPTNWYYTFNANKLFIVLHLKDGRTLYGWPEQWPDYPDQGHFYMDQPEWLLDDGSQVPVYNTRGMLIRAVDVEFVEFVRDPEDVTASAEEVAAAKTKLILLRKADDVSQAAATSTKPADPVRSVRASG